MKTLTIPYPDDWHSHLRDGNFLPRTVADISRQFQRAIVMPNLCPPITTIEQAQAYQERILKHRPVGNSFQPLMTLYLTESMTPDTIHQAKQSGIIFGCKLYPAGATTHSTAGITQLKAIYPLLDAMQTNDLPLLIHGEVVDNSVDIIQHEPAFIERELRPIVENFPNLRIVLEHISTKEAVEFVTEAPNTMAATITAHHLLLNLNDLLANGIKPHYYCKPIVKQIADQTALINAATSGNPKFFLGTDSAPHTQSSKECAQGCAGVYTAHAAIELYATVFEQHNALDKLEGFASCFGANFYQLPVNKKTLTLVHKPWQIPSTLTFGDEQLVPFFADQTLNWQIEHE